MKKRKNYTKSVVILVFCVLIFTLLSGCDLLRGNDANSTANNQGDGEKDPATEEHIHDFKPGYDIESHFVGCTCGEKINTETHSFDWVIDSEASYLVPGYKHKECQACGYVTEENTAFEKEKNEDGTLIIEDELKYTLLYYLKSNQLEEAKKLSLESIILHSKGNYNPLLINLSEEKKYYVCVYYTDEHEYEEIETLAYCCYDSYIWVGFESEEDIPEYYKGEKLLTAFQINTQVSCKNLKTGEINIVSNHFMLYTPRFEGGSNITQPASIDKILFYLTSQDNSPIYFTSISEGYKGCNLRCIEIDGEIYLSEYSPIKIEENHEIVYEKDLNSSFGKYYDQLINVMISDKYSETDTDANGNVRTYYYGIYNVEDLIDIIKNS